EQRCPISDSAPCASRTLRSIPRVSRWLVMVRHSLGFPAVSEGYILTDLLSHPLILFEKVSPATPAMYFLSYWFDVEIFGGTIAVGQSTFALWSKLISPMASPAIRFRSAARV